MTAEERIYLYAIAEAGVPARIRLLGRSLRALSAGNLSLIAERDRGDHQISEHTLRRQHAVVEALAGRLDPILPVRFGTSGSAGDLKAQALASAAALAAALDHVRGMTQMTVRVHGAGLPGEPASPASKPGLSGTEYLERRRTEHASLVANAGAIAAAAGALVVDERIDPPSRERFGQAGSMRGTIFHLIRKSDVAAYRRAVESCAPALEPATIVISGPFAPFAFAPPL